jgi:superfamily II DNA or RNA helicase
MNDILTKPLTIESFAEYDKMDPVKRKAIEAKLSKSRQIAKYRKINNKKIKTYLLKTKRTKKMTISYKNKRKEMYSLLRPHQSEPMEAIMNSVRGKIIYPTATGKTYMQAATICLDILQNPISTKWPLEPTRVYIIQVPRILLSYQILNENYKFFNHFGIPANYLVVHSGTAVDEGKLLDVRNANIDWVDIDVTTNKEVIKTNINKAQKMEGGPRPLVIVQTYHSADKTFETLDEMNIVPRIVQNDECQYLVSKEFSHLLKVPCEKMISYTATQKTAHRIGMENEELWGKTIAKMSPREAVDRGLIVRPRMIFKCTAEPISDEDARKSYSKFIKSDWEALKEVNYKVKNKMLVKTRGTDDMKIFIESKECESFIEDGVHVFVIGSNKNIDNWYNGDVYKRTEWLDKLQTIGADENAEMIVLHFDILSEGIDVPGFTAISLYSCPELDKFIQNFGRVARLNTNDRDNLENGKISVDNLDDWKKPYAWVIAHKYNDTDKSQADSISEMIGHLREYDFDPKRDITISEQRGIKDDDPMEDLLDDTKKTKLLGKVVDGAILRHEVECESDARLASLESNKSLEDLRNDFLSEFTTR